MAIWRPRVGEHLDVALGFERHEHADLAEALGRPGRGRRWRSTPLVDVELGDAAQGHVLADGGDEVWQACPSPWSRRRGSARPRAPSSVPSVSSASLAASRTKAWKLSLRATKSVSEFTSTIAARWPADLDGDEALGGDAAGLLGGLGEALLAQPVDRGLDVAVGLVERALAVHHARAGLLAQLLHHAAVMFAMAGPFRVEMRLEARRSEATEPGALEAPGFRMPCRSVDGGPMTGRRSGIRRRRRPRRSRGPGRPSRRGRCGRSASGRRRPWRRRRRSSRRAASSGRCRPR